jgi:hypothetical protein
MIGWVKVTIEAKSIERVEKMVLGRWFFERTKLT